jgi:hypothetical protein
VRLDRSVAEALELASQPGIDNAQLAGGIEGGLLDAPVTGPAEK